MPSNGSPWVDLPGRIGIDRGGGNQHGGAPMYFNKKLAELYRRHWDDLLEDGLKIDGPEPTSPMLSSIDGQAFAKAKKRIMICGQETKGWEPFGASVADCMECYHRFFIEREFYDGFGRSAFWKVFRYFEKEFRMLFGSDQCVFIYQNLCKMGTNDGKAGVTDQIRDLERRCFPVIEEEVSILQPDILIFLTGPDRDHDIRFHFPDAQLIQSEVDCNLRRKAWVVADRLPSITLRLYHPSYYRAWTNAYRDAARDLIARRI